MLDNFTCPVSVLYFRSLTLHTPKILMLSTSEPDRFCVTLQLQRKEIRNAFISSGKLARHVQAWPRFTQPCPHSFTHLWKINIISSQINRSCGEGYIHRKWAGVKNTHCKTYSHTMWSNVCFGWSEANDITVSEHRCQEHLLLAPKEREKMCP